MEDGVFNKHKEREGNLVTSIEPSVQVTLENVLKEIEKEWKSDAVGGIIINPTNGEIYGLANIPNFDPNYFNIENDSSVFPNPIVESVFEMGSTIIIIFQDIKLKWVSTTLKILQMRSK